MVKRIIHGKSYNTETATKIAESARNTLDNDSYNHFFFNSLYKTRHGTYFIHHGHDLYPEEADLIPLSAQEAQDWLQKHAATTKSTDLLAPAAKTNPESRFTLRMPDQLKQRIDEAASTHRQSTNAWIIRCLENALSK